MALWLRTVERLIGENSGPAATSGPNKGHSETNTEAWLCALARLVTEDIERRNRGRRYDGNMAAASQLGLILVAWYAHVHRAKTFDPNRPLEGRRAAAAQRVRYLAELQAIISDEALTGEVWGRRQAWNFPFGRGAKGGRFV